MKNHLFLNAGIPAPSIQFEQTSASQMSTWHSFSSAMELNCSSEQSSYCHFNPNSETSTDRSFHFYSALSSMVSSPAASNSNISNESFIIRELIGKLGNIGNSGEISPHSLASYMNNSASTATTSCYTTPLNSPPELNLEIMNYLVKEKLPSLGNSMTLNSSVAGFPADPGFAERAARFSRFGSKSFNGRTSQFAQINPESGIRVKTFMENEKLPRVSSSPSLKVLVSQANGVQGNKQDRYELATSQEESSISEQVQNGDVGLKSLNDFNSKKRKAVSKGNGKESAPAASSSPNNRKVAEGNDNYNSSNKRSKSNEHEGNSSVKAEEEAKNAGDDKQAKNNTRPPEPPKDYIHVRARRGQATDSHSLAERVRREKISERMKLLQDLVPGCNKVTGKALMLDEIINYVQSLQRQVEFLSMKLASVNTRLDFNVDALMSKDIYQSNKPLPHPIFQLDSSASAFYGHQPQQNPALHSNISNGTMPQCPMTVDPLYNAVCRNNLNMQLPQLDQFTESIPQYPNFCENDLQSIVQMGFGHNPNGEASAQSQSFHGPNQASNMKIEL